MAEDSARERLKVTGHNEKRRKKYKGKLGYG